MTTTRSASYPFDDAYKGEDNYRSFLRDEVVYAVIDWDTLDADLVARHDTLLSAKLSDLQALDLDLLHDLELWAVARSMRDQDADAACLNVMERILQTDTSARRTEINYTELRLEYARALAFFEKNTQSAHAQLEIYREEPQADLLEAERLAGLIEVLFGDVERGVERLSALVGQELEDDPELSIDIAEELTEYARFNEALRVLKAALEHAKSLGARAAILDLEEVVSVFPVGEIQAAAEESISEDPTGLATTSFPTSPVEDNTFVTSPESIEAVPDTVETAPETVEASLETELGEDPTPVLAHEPDAGVPPVVSSGTVSGDSGDVVGEDPTPEGGALEDDVSALFSSEAFRDVPKRSDGASIPTFGEDAAVSSDPSEDGI